MTDQQKIDYIYGRCTRLLDELDVDSYDREKCEKMLNSITHINQAYKALQETEYQLNNRGIKFDDPAEFVIQRYL